MLDALADREDVGIGGLHVVVDHDAAVDVETGLVGQVHVGTDAGRHHHQLGLERGVVRQRHAFDVPVVAEDRGGGAAEQHAHAQVLDLAEQVLPAVGIELPLHQRRRQVQHGDVAALHLQPARRLEAEQAAADHHRLHAWRRAPQDLAGVVERAERQHAASVQALDRRQERGAAGGQQQRVVGRDAAFSVGDGLVLGVDVHHAHADAQVDLVALVPLDRVDDDVVGRLLARQHRRQHDPVVVDVRLVAEHRHLEPRLVLEDLLQAVHPRHAVADHHQSLHRPPPAAARSTRTADCL